jgi:hypothetical protein
MTSLSEVDIALIIIFSVIIVGIGCFAIVYIYNASRTSHMWYDHNPHLDKNSLPYVNVVSSPPRHGEYLRN